MEVATGHPCLLHPGGPHTLAAVAACLHCLLAVEALLTCSMARGVAMQRGAAQGIRAFSTVQVLARMCTPSTRAPSHLLPPQLAHSSCGCALLALGLTQISR